MSRRRGRGTPPWLAAVLGMLVGLLIVAALLRVAGRPAAPEQNAQPLTPMPAHDSAHRPSPAPPFEAFDEHPSPPPAVIAPRAEEGARAASGLVLILDDVGYGSRQALDALLALPGPLTIAVLPGAPWAAEAARRAHAQGWVVMLHLPMEPRTPRYRARMDARFLRRGMDAAAIERTIAAALQAVPFAEGVNNHMGSLLTEDRRAMRAVMAVLHRRGLFFVDSLTTPNSVAAEVAAEAGVPWARRALFLDHDPRPPALARAWRRALACAARRMCVVIAHPHRATIAFLRDRLDDVRGRLRPIRLALHPAGDD